MKKTVKAISIRVAIVVFSAGALASCISNPDSPGHEYMPDMYRSPAVETYTDYGWIREREDTALTMELSAKHPPLNTIKYQGIVKDTTLLKLDFPYHRQAPSNAGMVHGEYAKDGWNIGKTVFGDYEVAAQDKNPIKLTPDNADSILKEGEHLFDINCKHCHGKKGDGEGPMVKSGVFMGVPDYRNLTIADGQMFYSIYYGKGMMGPQSIVLTKRKIWDVVHYINTFRFKNYKDSVLALNGYTVKSDSTTTAANASNSDSATDSTKTAK